MTKASDNLFPGIIIRESANDGSDFSNPSADYRRLFLGEDGLLHVKDSSGTVTSPYSSGTPSFRGCIAARTTDQTGVVTATLTDILFNATDVIDTDAFHDPSSNSNRITIPSGLDGKYRFSATIIWDTNSTGIRQIGLLKGGADFHAVHSHIASSGGEFTYQTITSGPVVMAATEYMTVNVYQTSGGNRTISGASSTCYFSAEFLGT